MPLAPLALTANVNLYPGVVGQYCPLEAIQGCTSYAVQHSFS